MITNIDYIRPVTTFPRFLAIFSTRKKNLSKKKIRDWVVHGNFFRDRVVHGIFFQSSEEKFSIGTVLNFFCLWPFSEKGKCVS